MATPDHTADAARNSTTSSDVNGRKGGWLAVWMSPTSRRTSSSCVAAAAIATVAASLQEFGWRQPIVVDEAMVILAGHTRLEAARQLGLTEVPVHVSHAHSRYGPSTGAAMRRRDPWTRQTLRRGAVARGDARRPQPAERRRAAREHPQAQRPPRAMSGPAEYPI